MSSLGCNRDCLRTYARHLNHVLQRNTQHNRKQYYSISLINKTLETNQNMDTFYCVTMFCGIRDWVITKKGTALQIGVEHIDRSNAWHNFYLFGIAWIVIDSNFLSTTRWCSIYLKRKYDFVWIRYMVSTPLIISYLSPENHLPVLSSTVRTSFQWNFLTSISVQFYVLAASKDLWYAFSHHIFYMICNIMFLVELKYTQKIFLCFGTTMFVCVSNFCMSMY